VSIDPRSPSARRPGLDQAAEPHCTGMQSGVSHGACVTASPARLGSPGAGRRGDANIGRRTADSRRRQVARGVVVSLWYAMATGVTSRNEYSSEDRWFERSGSTATSCEGAAGSV
jgi:hypothetical protein